MRWGSPYILISLIIIPILLIFVSLTEKRRKKKFSSFAELRFYDFFMQEFSNFHWNLKNVLIVTALFFLIIAVARPQWDKEVQIVKKEGIDIVVCIDVSKSMEAQDIQPSRIERAKDQISQFIDQLKGDRIALVAFAGRSFVQCPLTDDYGAAKLFLSLMDTESITAYGTNIGDALEKGYSLFGESQKYKVMVLISDGEDLEEQAIEVAEDLSKKGVVIYTLGIGTLEGSTIPVDDGNGNTVYAKDDEGNIILTKLDVQTLTQLASAGNGRFYPVTPQQSEIYEIMKNISTIEKQKYSSREFIRYKEQYRYFVLVGIFVLFIESLIIHLKKRKYQKVI